MSRHDDHPLSLFREALGSAVGRTLTFLAVCVLAMGAVFLVGFLLRLVSGAHGPGVSRLVHVQFLHIVYLTVGSPLVWISVVGVGVFQGWGLMSYAILAGLFLAYAKNDGSPGRILPAAFLVQYFETSRCACAADGWRSVGSLETIASAALGSAAAAAYVVYLVRTRERKPLLGG